MERWSGKVAVITGATSGVGVAIALELVKHGMHVVAVARRVESIERMRKTLPNVPGKLYPYKADISEEEQVIKTFKWVKEIFGQVHVLINNAGIARTGMTVDLESKYMKEIFDVNVLGLCFCTQQAYKLMVDSGVNDGHIIHINSVVGHVVSQINPPTFNVYSASKHAVTALTETLRQELRFLKTKIRITSISPGAVESDLMSANVVEQRRLSGGPSVAADVDIPMLKPEDVAGSVIYVLSTPPHVQVHDLMIRPVGEVVV